MFKATNTSALTSPYGINVSSSAYGKAVRLLYGLCQAKPDLVWYNDWSGGPNGNKGKGKNKNSAALEVVTGASVGKKGGKKTGQSYFAAVDLLLGHAPVLGVLSAWYNNQKFGVVQCSASGLVSGGAFSFTPVATNGIGTYAGTVPSSGPYVITVPNFVADTGGLVETAGGGGIVITGASGVVVGGKHLNAVVSSPGAGQYSVDTSGDYTFNVAQAGQAVSINYFQSNSGSASTLVAIYAATVAETFSETFNDFGAPGSVTVYGTWQRPLWNAAFAVPGRIDAGAYRARDPYTWWWDGSTAKAYFPAALEGLPVTVYYGVPAIFKSDGSFYSDTITPLELMNLEFEPAFGSGSEYANHTDQQVAMSFCVGLGSGSLDLGVANSVPNLNLETIGAFTQWPNGDADVADIVADIVASGPVLV